MVASARSALVHLIAWCVRGAAVAGLAAAAPASAFETDVRPLLESGCMACHGNTVPSTLDPTAIGHDLTKSRFVEQGGGRRILEVEPCGIGPFRCELPRQRRLADLPGTQHTRMWAARCYTGSRFEDRGM